MHAQKRRLIMIQIHAKVLEKTESNKRRKEKGQTKAASEAATGTMIMARSHQDQK